MLYFVLIGLCLVLVGVAALQFMYMFYLDRLDNERKKRIVELEHRCKDLTQKLAEAEFRISEQRHVIEAFDIFENMDEEAWADVIEES
jgi:hypothetical protein